MDLWAYGICRGFFGSHLLLFYASISLAWRLDPTGPAVMVGLFGVATVYLVYRAGRDMSDPWVGIVAERYTQHRRSS